MWRSFSNPLGSRVQVFKTLASPAGPTSVMKEPAPKTPVLSVIHRVVFGGTMATRTGGKRTFSPGFLGQ